jgi:hypothetical protein
MHQTGSPSMALPLQLNYGNLKTSMISSLKAR